MDRLVRFLCFSCDQPRDVAGRRVRLTAAGQRVFICCACAVIDNKQVALLEAALADSEFDHEPMRHAVRKATGHDPVAARALATMPDLQAAFAASKKGSR